MTCPGSVKLSEAIQDRESRYATEGTAAHELAELILRGQPALAPENTDGSEFL